MSVVSIPIVNKNYPMGCEDGQESRLIDLGKMVDARAREILDKIGPLPENSLLATLCIVLADEVSNRGRGSGDNLDLQEILARIREIKQKINV
ncbi:MAG: cell division protein ZapA [Rickettsiales bacterium]|jgi:cell division protein ZapA|nr:cell division protein ZapA [Rickettsiales bacterium]